MRVRLPPPALSSSRQKRTYGQWAQLELRAAEANDRRRAGALQAVAFAYAPRVTTAEIAIVSSAGVGFAGVLAPSLTAWLDWQHQQGLARAERRHAVLVQVYREAGAYLERLRLVILR